MYKKIKLLVCSLIINLFIGLNIHAQILVSETLINSISQSELANMIPLPLFQFGIDAYKIQYYTNNIHGEESIASGLIVIPLNNDYPSSLTSYLHGTIVHKEDVPSRQILLY